ncbi:DUF3592 domain-containing protein [Panacibacter ginsenosidivorans]|uniref:DUF3592 domain-containing protein n=1 Tax=Panacibacter ginsenosidivorans TaxID=1813871 RepID=A0A5B8V3P2_9BACT|nr:DUF3592 domain-containing protein [Panacibacter ginsenosidivorans]QEC65822.1 DUF3592 domain-containing protein [Panacibacter ginsenosidivorans]
MTTAFLVFKLIIFIFLLCLLFYFFVFTTIKKLLRRRKIRTQGEKALASVIDYKMAKDSDRVRSYFPVLQFRTKDDQVVTVHSKKARTTKYPAGHMITVYYMRADPSKFYISGLVPFIKIAGIILGSSGVVLLCYEIFKTVKLIIAGA